MTLSLSVSAPAEGAEPAQDWSSLPLSYAKMASGNRTMTTKSSETSRSPSPDGSSTSNYGAPSSPTTSWATSNRPNTEFNFMNDEEADRCGYNSNNSNNGNNGNSNNPNNNQDHNKWDSYSARMASERPSTPLDRLRSHQGRSTSRPSSLRNSISVCEGSALEASEPVDEEYLESDASNSNSDAEISDDEDEGEDTGWSGANDNLESRVLAILGEELGMAVDTIVKLHRNRSFTINSKVESWNRQCAATTTATPAGTEGGGGAQGNHSYGNNNGNGFYNDSLPDNPRKRRRRASSDGRGRGVTGGGGGGDGDEDEDDEEPAGDNLEKDLPGNGQPQRMLACPFHKMNPTKYGIQHNSSSSAGNANAKRHRYRTCQGPGFKSIQRLKEHLKRTHYPVQCERCHEIFPGTDRAACQVKLAEHRRMEVPCPLKDAANKEGIDEAQWASLERQNRKKSQETHRFEKWFQIWEILFPGVAPPKTPWHDENIPVPSDSSSPSGDAKNFAQIFMTMLEYKMQQQDIKFPPQAQDLDRLRTLAQQAFDVYFSLTKAPQTDGSSSTDRLTNNQLSSFLSGSSSHLSGPATSGSHHKTISTGATTATDGSGNAPNTPAGPAPTPYALNLQGPQNGSPYGMGMPLGQSPNQRQFISAAAAGMPVVGQAASPIPNMPNMPNFFAMGPPADGTSAFYPAYNFGHQQPWASPSGNVGAYHAHAHHQAMHQDYLSDPNMDLYGDAQNFCPGQDGVEGNFQ